MFINGFHGVTRSTRSKSQNTDLIRLEIKCAVDNIRSQRVAEKAGVAREGIRESCLELHGKKHDAEVFSLQKGRVPNKTNVANA